MNRNLVILFYPKTEKENINRNIPLSFLKIGSELKGNGREVVIIDERLTENYEGYLKGVIDKAICFGVSAMTGYQICGGLKASSLVKNMRRDLPVVWGGWHPSLLPEETLSNINIDIVVRGQGEKTICELVSALIDNADLKGIAGISYKDNGNILFNNNRTFHSLNDFLPVRFDVMEIEKYTFKSPLGDRSIFWNSSQGCPYSCGFCSTPTVYNKKWSGLNADILLGQIERLVHEYNIDGATFAEDNFFVDSKRIEKFCLGLIEKKINIKWATDVRIDQVNRFSLDFMRLLKESGCSKLYVGAESGDEEVLGLIDKNVILDDIYNAAAVLDKHKIISEFFIIVGFPNNPKRDLKETLQLMKRIKCDYPDHQFTPFLYTPYPGTPLLELAIKNGLKLPNKLEGWINWSILSVSTPWVNNRYLDRINKYAKFFYPLAYPSLSLRKKFNNGLKGLPYLVLHKIAELRVKNGIFLFPIEWKMIKSFYKMKLKLKLFKEMESFR